MKFSKILFALPLCLLEWGILSCSAEVAGGSSEETNSIAGILQMPGGSAAAHVAVEARLTTNGKFLYTDTTDERGEFSIAVRSSGTYGVSASTDSFAFYDTVSVFGKSVTCNGSLAATDSIRGRIFLRKGIPAENATVELSGSPWKTVADSDGSFVLRGVPRSRFALAVTSPEPTFALGVSIPFSPEEFAIESVRRDVFLPLSPDYSVAGFWTFDFASDGYTADTKGLSGKAKLFGNASLDSGLSETKALRLESAADFAVVEEDRGVLDNATELSVEAWVKFSRLDTGKASIENIFGKLGFSDSAVFSLAVVNDTCGAEGAAFAFFLSQGSGDSLRCETAAISKVGISEGWNYLTASWDGDSTKIFVNGILSGAAESPIESLVGENGIPLYFGKGNLSLILDDVRISTVALEDVDAEYRYGGCAK